MLVFGDLRFDAATRQVSRESGDIHITRKAFDLLALLVERRPEAVSKEEIHTHLWPDTFVADITLHSLVSEIRRGLGDDTSHPRFIRTVHGFGYAFICPLTEPARSNDGPRRVRGWLMLEHHSLPVFEGENVFGRGDADVGELPSSTVSRRHACIRVDADAWIDDLGSKNGTFVGEQRVTAPVRLADGAQLRFASLLMTFRLARPADATSTQSTADVPRQRPG